MRAACLEFNGNTSVVNCGSDASLDNLPDNVISGKGPFTVDGWIYINSWGEGNTACITGKSQYGLEWYFQVHWGWGLRAFIDYTTTDAISEGTLASFNLDGAWHHVLMCYDETGAGTPAARTIYLSVDGVWLAAYNLQQNSVGNYVGDGTRNLFIGNFGNGTRGFDGDIGWVRISDSIRWNPAGGNFTPPPRCAPPTADLNTVLLLGQYPGYGSITWDQSGNGNDGTLTDTTWERNCPAEAATMTIGYDNYRPNHNLLLDLQFREATGAVTRDWAKPYHDPVTLVNTPTWATLGNDLSYLNFDPTASEHIVIALADSGDLDFTTGSFSGAVWFYPDLYGSRLLFCKSDGVTGWSFQITSGDHHVYFSTYQAGPTVQETFGAPDLALAAWQLVGFTRAGAVAKIYLNGVDATTVPDVHVDPAAAALNFYIGCYDLAASGFIDGGLWRPRVWDRALDAWEFEALFESERDLFGV